MHLDNPVNPANSKSLRLLKAEYLHLCAAALVFVILILFLPRDLPWQLRSTVGLTGTAIWLWVFEPIPMPLTALLVVAGLPVIGAVPFETALQGFSNGSVFLIMAGFMMARGVNSTALGKRLAYFTMVSFGGSVRGVLWGVLLAPQVLSLFIPATAVRTTLLLPAVMAVLGALNLNKGSNTAKLMVLGLACGASISGIGFLPAAIANVLTADLLRTSVNMPIYYFQWLKITWPVWLLMLPLTWLILLKVFPPEVSALDLGDLRKELSDLGALDMKEKKCLMILVLTVGMWMTESLHGLPTAVPALLAV
ncbi:MAG TPA: SLC13 family permease, partial [Verrucomicrobiae bacterium]|nr:SLC13 family permease [Verrucomicrobiae bacterium]